MSYTNDPMKMLSATLTCWLLLLLSFLLIGCGQPDQGGTSVALSPGPADGSLLRGTVRFEGPVPNLPPLSLEGDPKCVAKYSDTAPSRILTVSPEGGMADVLVSISSGLEQRDWPIPSEPAVLDQVGCLFVPHVVGMQAGQPFRILNSDGILHNVHPLPKINYEFNIAMPPERLEMERVFSDPEETPFPVLCNVHTWMRAWVAVFSHPFFAVSDQDGRFRLPNPPPGKYEITAWHERLGTQSIQVGFDGEQEQILEFAFSR